MRSCCASFWVAFSNTTSTKLWNFMLSFDLVGTKMPFGGRQKPIE